MQLIILFNFYTQNTYNNNGNSFQWDQNTRLFAI